jgi:response regulator NasT
LLRVLVIDESRRRAADICAGLALAGHQVATILPSAPDLAGQLEKLRPDVILIETGAPSRDTLEHLGAVSRKAPMPAVVFARESDAEVIRAAVRAGVSACVVDGLDPQRIKPVIEVARARLEDYQAPRRELAEAMRKHSERKPVERARASS